MPGRIAKAGDSELDVTVTCKCPKCGRLWESTFAWTGRGMPRKHCRDCQHLFSHSEVYSEIEIHGSAELSRWARLGWV